MQPQSPNPQYDFIFKDGQSAKKKGGLPLPNLPKPALIAVGGILLVFVLIIVFSIFSSGKSSNSQQYLSAIYRAQEIARVSVEVEQISQDSSIQNLASTTNNVLSGQQKELTDYVTSLKLKVNPKALGADMSTATDTQIKNASANGTLSSTYTTYVKTELAKYQTDLQTAYKSSGSRGKTILSDAYGSVGVILKSPQLAAN